MDRASVRQPGKPAAGTGAACLPKGPTSSHVPGFAAGASERMLPFCRRPATCPQQAATRCAPGHDVGTGQHALLARHGRPCAGRSAGRSRHRLQGWLQQTQWWTALRGISRRRHVQCCSSRLKVTGSFGSLADGGNLIEANNTASGGEFAALKISRITPGLMRNMHLLGVQGLRPVRMHGKEGGSAERHPCKAQDLPMPTRSRSKTCDRKTPLPLTGLAALREEDLRKQACAIFGPGGHPPCGRPQASRQGCVKEVAHSESA